MYAKSLFIIHLMVCLLVSAVISQIDTIQNSSVYRTHVRVSLRTIGLVENNIMYASQAIDGDDVVIIDVSTVLTGGMYHDSVLLDTIPRSGATQWANGRELFSVVKRSDLLYFNDGTNLKIYDVSDPQGAISKHSMDLGEEIITIKLSSDSIFVAQQNMNFDALTYNTTSAPTIVHSNDFMGGGTNIFITDKYFINFRSVSVWVWNLPINANNPDWEIGLAGGMTQSAGALRDDYLFATSSLGTVVYDVSDMDNFRAIDTLPGGFGEYIVLHKNLLIVAKDNGGDEDVDIFDVSDVNNIRHVAYWGSPAGGIAVDPATNYLYLEIETGENSEWFDMIDLTPYVDEPAKSISLTSPSASTKWEKGSTQTITWSSTGYIDEVALEYNLGGGWEVITASTPNDGSYAWTVPDSASNTVTVRITDEYGQVTVESEEFAIEPPLGVVTREGSRGFRFIRSVRGMEFYVPEAYNNLTIYDLQGQRVRSLFIDVGAVHWDGRNASGMAVQKGLYIARLQGQGEAKAVRFAVY